MKPDLVEDLLDAVITFEEQVGYFGYFGTGPAIPCTVDVDVSRWTL